MTAVFRFGFFFIRLDEDGTFLGDELRPRVVPRLCNCNGSNALLVSLPSMADGAEAVVDKTCFLFGVINPSFGSAGVVVAVPVSFGDVTVDAATLKSFSVVSKGLSGVTSCVSFVDAC
jgi:hypothetical protein